MTSTNHTAAPDRQPEHNRSIRSFVRREGRLTAAQERAIAKLYPLYGAPVDGGLLSLDTLFGRSAPCTLEIGFGNGDSLCQMAANHPERNYLGVEVHRPGLGRLLLKVSAMGLANVRVVHGDATAIMRDRLADGSIDGLQLFFPDPWPKKRHHKRRLVQPGWVAVTADKLKVGGTLHMATDWEDYARHMLAVVEASEAFENIAGPGQFSPRPQHRPVTKFELRGLRLDHQVRDLLFRRSGAGA